NALKAYENQDYPFEELVDKVNINRDMSRNPVFDTMFVLQNMQQEEKGIQGLQLIPYVGKHKISKFDLTLIGIEEEGHVSCMIEYATALYKEETIKRMSEHFMQLIDAIINDSQVKLSSLEIITPQEKAQILDVFNKTAIEYSSEKTIHQLFEEQVQRTPNQVAVVFENQQLTYQELNERANQLARTLRSEGVRSEQLVAIMAERSLEMIIGILGVLKAGGAYVPIDPEYPEERIQYMLKDSKAQLLLLQQHLQDHIPFEGKLVNLNDEASYHKDGSNLKSIVASNQLAYVIYTSGTTGKPKGVMVEHHGLCNLKSVMYDTLQMNEQDKVVQFASLSFDASIWEIFTSLFFGATLYIPSKSVILDYHLFNHFMNENKITTATLPPAYATYLEPTQIPFLRKLITAGSSSSIQLVNKWRGHVMYVNAYGPTEDSICSTVWTSRDKLSGNNSIPIGRPIHNHQVYIMDKTGQLLPIGVAGELCIAGLGVARGYLNRPDLTKEKFVENPFVSGEKMYKTGDLARWLTDGSIEYLGRIDHQVKIRGNRIEIGEVETALLEIESIQEVIVIAREDKDGLKQLCAYYVGDDSLTVGKLRNELSKKLPNYIIPSYFVKLTQMPLTPNGKVDRKALPKLGENVQTETEYEAPRTAAEVQLVEIWKEVLGLEQIGIKENFFDIGGHSLKVLQLIRKVSQSIGVNLPYRVVFDTPTIETMAQQIMTSQLGMEKNTDFLKLNDEGDINVFCFPSTISGLGMEYFEMAKRLENQCILYAYDFIEYHSNYTDMINEYVESIISIQKQGPYVFLGYSAGGNLAFEIAKVMEKSGLEISDIIMLDTSLMNPEMQRLREKLLERDIDNNENISEWFKQVKDIPSVKNKSYCYEEYMKQLDNNGIVKSNIHNLVVKGLDKSNWLNATMKNYIEYEGFGNHNEMLNRKFIDANVGIIKLVLNEIIERNVEMNLV
ncbi:non-ribosomal peptide synthetase, partial [Bacillus pseudomycoides]